MTLAWVNFFPNLSCQWLSFSCCSLWQRHIYLSQKSLALKGPMQASFWSWKENISFLACAIHWKPFHNPKLVTVLGDRCHPKQAWIILLVFLANPARLWTHSVNKRDRSTKLLTLPAFLPVCWHFKAPYVSLNKVSWKYVFNNNTMFFRLLQPKRSDTACLWLCRAVYRVLWWPLPLLVNRRHVGKA